MAVRRKRNRRVKDEIDRIFDSIKIKDLPREEFRRRYLRLTSPRGLRQDLAAIMNKQAIDRGLQRAVDH